MIGGTRSNIEILDLVRGTGARFRAEPYTQAHPIWSPDGGRIVFAANPNGPEDLYSRASNGMGEAQLVHGSSVPHKHPNDWSRDGRFVLFDSTASDGTDDLWVLPLAGDEDPYSLKTSPALIAGGQFSPDGRWVAYGSEESGRFEIYLQDFPEGSERWKISTDGGTQMRWRSDGKELFYLDPASKLMAVDFASDAGGEPKLGLPKELFQTRMLQNPRHRYDVTADGERFLMSVLAGEPSPIVVIVNWYQDIEQDIQSH